MTVSRAFKGDKSIKRQTRDKMLKKADELGYVFDATAANLRQNRTGPRAGVERSGDPAHHY